jgi:hypothetical protein
MAGEWRRASEAYGVSYGIHPFGMLAPVPPEETAERACDRKSISFQNEIDGGDRKSEEIISDQNEMITQHQSDRNGTLSPPATTETTVDGTLSIGRFVVRLQLLIRRSRRE